MQKMQKSVYLEGREIKICFRELPVKGKFLLMTDADGGHQKLGTGYVLEFKMVGGGVAAAKVS